MKGRVIFYNFSEKYGFISGSQGGSRDYFFHSDDLRDCLLLEKGDIVSFEKIQTSKGLRAANVRKIGKEI